jgi:hypothetical protein
MRYVNITTRHHDSFCLFASKQTDFKSVNSTVRSFTTKSTAFNRKSGRRKGATRTTA